jgi:hypothetical protein
MHLTILSLPILLIASIIHSRTMFVMCGKHMAHYFGPILLKLKIEQLSEHEYYQNGSFHSGHKNAVATGKRLADKFKGFINSIGDDGRNLGHRELATYCFVEAYSGFAFLQPFIQAFLNQNADIYQQIRLWGVEAAIGELWPDPMPANVSIIKGAPLFGRLFRFVGDLVRVTIAMALPLINFAVLWRKGVRPALRPRIPHRLEKRILFLHRFVDMVSGVHSYRDMYLIRNRILRPDQCVHSTLNTRIGFGEDKRKFLEDAGGEILEIRDLSISLKELFQFLIKDHLLTLRKLLPAIIFEDGINVSFLRLYLEYCHMRLIARALIDASGADIVFAETEYQSIVRAMGAAARSKSIRMVTMIHGSGGQSFVTFKRSFSWADYYIVEGNDYRALSINSPSLRYIYPAGNIELSSCRPTPDLLPTYVQQNRNQYKVVAFLLNLGTNFLDMHSLWSGSHYINPDKIKKLVLIELKPIFDWIAQDERIILVWCTKPRDVHENQFLQPLISQIPPERLVINHNFHMGGVIALSDLCLTTSGSSAVSVSMLTGIPSVSHDMHFDGLEEKFHPRMTGRTGEEFAENAKFVLEHGLPEEAFQNIVDARHGDVSTNMPAEERISALFQKLLQSDMIYPEPPTF